MLNIRCYEKDVKREMSEFFTDYERETYTHTYAHIINVKCQIKWLIRSKYDNLVLHRSTTYSTHQTVGCVFISF